MTDQNQRFYCRKCKAHYLTADIPLHQHGVIARPEAESAVSVTFPFYKETLDTIAGELKAEVK